MRGIDPAQRAGILAAGLLRRAALAAAADAPRSAAPPGLRSRARRNAVLKIIASLISPRPLAWSCFIAALVLGQA